MWSSFLLLTGFGAGGRKGRFGNIQTFTVPRTTCYLCYRAWGDYGYLPGTYYRGKGAFIKGKFRLNNVQLKSFSFLLLEFIARMCGFVFKIWNSEKCLIYVIQKHFWDLSTQTTLNVPRKSFKSLKASLEVRKLSFLFESHNSNSVWE